MHTFGRESIPNFWVDEFAEGRGNDILFSKHNNVFGIFPLFSRIYSMPTIFKLFNESSIQMNAEYIYIYLSKNQKVYHKVAKHTLTDAQSSRQ